MGQKVNPHGLRVGVNKDWNSKWYADKADFANYLAEDNQIRKHVKKELYGAGISSIVIERNSADRVRINVLAARPGMIIGSDGSGIEKLKKGLAKITDKKIDINIEEVRRYDLDAQLTAESVAQSLERRTSFRRAMKQPIGRAMKAGAKGIKIECSGRLGGAEIARKEKYSEGNVPLHTLRADIDYGFAGADTTYGKIGVKVWINHGEILDKGLKEAIPETSRNDRRDRKNRKNDRRSKRNFEGRDRRRNDRRDARPEIKPATTRVRKQPKVEAPVQAEVENTPAEVTEE